MNPNVNYCDAPQEEATFGAQYQAYSYRWTGSCLAVPEHEPTEIRKTVLHALASSTATKSPLLVVMILPAWEDSPWRTLSKLSHYNITTLVHLKPNQLKFIPASEQLDTNLDMNLLRAADHPTNVVVVANTEGIKSYLHLARLQHILIPSILKACQNTAQTIKLFPTQTPQALTSATPLPSPPSDRSPTPAYTTCHSTHNNPVVHLHTTPPIQPKKAQNTHHY